MTLNPVWLKSSYSKPELECVEIACHPQTTHVRDSKLGSIPQLAFSTPTWACFIAHIPGV
ncbi:DUF397 domain-containing protein [Streptomyces sp. AV19]|uniref:DUF397 domain-containing protein n=1 Tax=Streptomyces sp. AV19 TaxID=2793068 RepID=UPI0018FE2023|nr:DUF397 domain-containing protein [Streptomyces sp. AV19]MBH1937314.1 DUF397 domain-containing protein [Streptomyces sp. AV19]MDG4536792.1 DUF397 domain-containing protein [Streptomyces sp. AV19]